MPGENKGMSVKKLVTCGIVSVLFYLIVRTHMVAELISICHRMQRNSWLCITKMVRLTRCFLLMKSFRAIFGTGLSFTCMPKLQLDIIFGMHITCYLLLYYNNVKLCGWGMGLNWPTFLRERMCSKCLELKRHRIPKAYGNTCGLINESSKIFYIWI